MTIFKRKVIGKIPVCPCNDNSENGESNTASSLEQIRKTASSVIPATRPGGDKSKLIRRVIGKIPNPTAEQLQSDWNQSDNTKPDYINNKPTIPEEVTVDTELSDTSENPIQNKVIKKALDDKQPKVAGKGLSTNDYTNQDKEKVAVALTEHQDISGKADKTSLQEEVTRATNAEENLRQLYNNLQQSQPIPVTELPATGEAGKIYRLAGATSYADYMYAEGALATPIKMAEYNNAIDEELIPYSDNLVRGGAVAGYIFQSTPANVSIGEFLWDASDVHNNAKLGYSLDYIVCHTGDVVTVNCGNILEIASENNASLRLYNSEKEIIRNYTLTNNRTITLDNNDVAYLRTSLLLSKKDANVVINGAVVWKMEYETISKGLQESIEFVKNGNTSNLNLPDFELGTILPNGDNHSNTVGHRTPNGKKIKIESKHLVLHGNVSVLKTEIPEVSTIRAMIQCYDADTISLGRFASAYIDITDKDVKAQLLDGTSYIRIIFSVQDSNGSDIDVSSQTSFFNSVKDELLIVKEDIDGLTQLNEKVDSLIREDEGYDYTYKGNIVNLDRRFKAEPFMSVGYQGETGQGCVSYGVYLLVGSAGGYINVYDITTKEQLAVVQLASASANNHVNNLCFGKEGDLSNSLFDKYLYVSAIGGSNNDNKCYVENFSLSGSQLVQTIQYQNTLEISLIEWLVDYDNDILYGIGCDKSIYDSDNKMKFLKFRLPKISEGSIVTLTDDDILDSWEYDGSINYMYIFQGAYYYQGKIYLSCGGYDNGQGTMPHNVFVIDTHTGRVDSIINVGQVYAAECEAVTVYNGKMLACYPNQQIVYALSF